MARPKRAIPFRQGSLAKITKFFFEPLKYYRPDDMMLKDWMEILFHLKERDITQYVAKRDFKMPGLFYLAPLVKIQGFGYRYVLKDTPIMVRHDGRDSFWDVEFFGGVGEREQVFQLSEQEWNLLKLDLEEALPRGMRKRPSRSKK